MNKNDLASGETDKPASQEVSPGFISSALDEYGLTAQEMRVAVHILRRGVCSDSLATMQHCLFLHPDTIRDSLQFFVNQNLVRMEEYKGYGNTYEWNPIKLWFNPPSPGPEMKKKEQVRRERVLARWLRWKRTGHWSDPSETDGGVRKGWRGMKQMERSEKDGGQAHEISGEDPSETDGVKGHPSMGTQIKGIPIKQNALNGDVPVPARARGNDDEKKVETQPMFKGFPEMLDKLGELAGGPKALDKRNVDRWRLIFGKSPRRFREAVAQTALSVKEARLHAGHPVRNPLATFEDNLKRLDGPRRVSVPVIRHPADGKGRTAL